MPNLLLKAEYLVMLQDIFKELIPNCSVIAYGSRVGGDAHSGSDLDLAVMRNEKDSIDILTLRESLKESNIPFHVDIFDFLRLPKSFQQEIAKQSIEIYPNYNPNQTSN